ncbi:alpha/beta hydrolase family protein [Streptomyces sp. NPDC058955]|uniref:alpha/beta hydrolase family protein n=1 Tax=unclassified Streptomyces TaxID=2593676 RepID=UPI003663EB30
MTIDGGVGPSIRVLFDGSREDWREPGRPRPVRVYDWVPDGGGRGTVVVSHGTGGSGADMEWLVRPLLAAGFRAVALDHHGNNHVDGYEPEGFLWAWERPRDVTFVLDRLAEEGPLGPVGAAGFSLGGYTAAAVAGARLDPVLLEAVLTGAVPLPPLPEFPGVLDALRAKRPGQGLPAGAGDDLTDPRVRAVFQVAPGVGALVTRDSLAGVRVPVGIRWGGADTINPYDVDVRPYLEHVPGASGASVGPAVRHDDFFADHPADPGARLRAGEAAAAFFTAHLV